MKLFLSASGRLSRRAFLPAVLLVYAAGLASQALTAPVVLDRVSLLAFAFAQLVILWSWYALHAKRLRDAGRPSGLAAGIAIVYLLGLVLLLMVLFFFMMPKSGSGDMVPASSFVGLLVVLWVFGLFGGQPVGGATDFFILLPLFAAIAAPLLLVLGATLWAGTRASAP